MRLEHIYRHPVKGLTPEALDRTRLEAGAGVPFDRACGFTSGNLPDPPVAGGWVPARTFIQLTVYPELARFRTRLDEDSRTFTLSAPDGESIEVGLDDGSGVEAANDLIARHFAAGPHGAPALHVQTRPRGHWDFADSGISILNLASLRALEAAADTPIDARRFRANLHIDGIEPWAEFGLIGGRYRFGEAVIDIVRPAMRCAATQADPETGDTDLNVPVLLRRATGHLFFAVYGRAVESGEIRRGDRIERIGDMAAAPDENLPPRAPDPRQWPRAYNVASSTDGSLRLTSPVAHWPLPVARVDDEMVLHPGLGQDGPCQRVRVVEANPEAILIAAPAKAMPNGKCARTHPHRPAIARAAVIGHDKREFIPLADAPPVPHCGVPASCCGATMRL